MFGEKKFTGVGFPTPVSIPDETTCLLIQVPANTAWWALMVGVLYTLTLEWNWRQFEGGLDPNVAAAKWQEILDQALDIASVSNSCDYDVPAPYWDDDTADDADDEGTIVEQPWYGEIVNEGVTWREQVGIWAITAFLAIAATPGAAIAFLPFANKFVLAFKQHSIGAIVKVLLDGVEMVTVDTYAPTDGIQNVTISLPAPVGLRAFDVDAPVLWVMNTGDANPAVTGTPTMAVIRKRLDQTEVTPSNIRWDATCDCTQQTPDGGDTWVDSPTQDPRYSSIFQLPARTGGDPHCDSAQQMHDRIKNMLDAVITSSNILQAINGVVALVSIFLFEFGIIIEAIWAFVSTIFNIGTTTLDAALTETVYDDLLCILYCEIESDGTVTQGDFDTIYARVNDEIGGVAAIAITNVLLSIGNVGLTNAGALGEVTGDCDSCDCGWEHCVNLLDVLPETVTILTGTWVSTQGVRFEFDPVHVQTAAYVQFALPSAAHVTKLECTYIADETGSDPISGIRADDESVGLMTGGVFVGENSFNVEGDFDYDNYAWFVVPARPENIAGSGYMQTLKISGNGDIPVWANECV